MEYVNAPVETSMSEESPRRMKRTSYGTSSWIVDLSNGSLPADLAFAGRGLRDECNLNYMEKKVTLCF